MEFLLELDRSAAELLLGRRDGRPTISARVGDVMAAGLGLTREAGKSLFHWMLVLVFGFVFIAAVLPWVARKVRG